MRPSSCVVPSRQFNQITERSDDLQRYSLTGIKSSITILNIINGVSCDYIRVWLGYVFVCVNLLCRSEEWMCKIMDPTEKGVWWKNDKQWELFSPSNARKILRAWSSGETQLTLGPFKSLKHPSGALYKIDLVSMKQTNLNTGFSRDIKIIPDQNDEEEDESDGDFCGEVSAVKGAARTSKVHVQKDKNVVTMIPSVTVDLQKLSTQCRVEDQCNLVIKLPQAVAPSSVRLNSLTNKMMSLMLEKLSSKDFIKTVVRNKLSDSTWTVEQCNPYRLGRADRSDRYGAFLSNLCELSQKEDDFVDRLFSVAEQGNTVEGDPVEYLFKIGPARLCNRILSYGVSPVEGLNRSPPSKMNQKEGNEAVIYMIISKFLEVERGRLNVPGTGVPLGLLVAEDDGPHRLF